MGSARTRGKTLRCGRQGMSPAPPPPPACSIKGGRGRASSHLSLLLLLPLLSATVSAKDVFTNHFLVHLDPEHGHPDPPALARDIAKRNGFHSLGPLLNSPHEFHFVHAGLPHARHKNFTMLQGLEYYEARFTFADSIYGSTFFIATGFHGLHVIVGTIFLIVT